MQTYARWGEGTVKHLERLGVLDKKLLAVHTVWLTDEELELFRKREIPFVIAHNKADLTSVPAVMPENEIYVSAAADSNIRDTAAYRSWAKSNQN